jgi:2-deoxy-D-gluconate 3-dehydrogenase
MKINNANPVAYPRDAMSHVPVLDSFRLDGRVALVTGADRGLGQGLAVALAEAGADIAGLSRGAAPGAVETGQAIAALGRRFVRIPCDLRQASVAGLQQVIARLVAALGRLDILVNNAGNTARGPALELAEADWDAVIQVDLKALFFLSQAAARVMAGQGGGKIINLASVLSFQGGLRVPAYAAAKSGVAGLTRALANEWAGQGINVNAIAPGYMATEMTAPLLADPQRSKAIVDRVPAGRWGTPADLAGAVVFLAAPASDYVHGAILPVDGGWLAR